MFNTSSLYTRCHIWLNRKLRVKQKQIQPAQYLFRYTWRLRWLYLHYYPRKTIGVTVRAALAEGCDDCTYTTTFGRGPRWLYVHYHLWQRTAMIVRALPPLADARDDCTCTTTPGDGRVDCTCTTTPGRQPRWLYMHYNPWQTAMSVCACVCVCARACVRAWVCVYNITVYARECVCHHTVNIQTSQVRQKYMSAIKNNSVVVIICRYLLIEHNI